MWFGEAPVREAEGAILVHSLRFGKTALKKGRILSAEDVAQIAAGGVDEVTVVRLEPGDIREDPAKLVVMGPPDADVMEEGTGQYEEIPNLRDSYLKRLWMEPGGVFKTPKRFNPPISSGLIKRP